MDINLCEAIVRELHELGTARVILGGWGDPLLHPQFDRILELLLKLRMAPYVITNGLAVDEQRARHWAGLPVHFRFSLHAGDPETWLKIHTSCAPYQFELLNQAIRRLVEGGKATVSIMHAMQKANFRNLEKMVEHARHLGVQQILFLPVQAEGHLSRHAVLAEDEETELRGDMIGALHLAASLGIRTNLADYMETNRFVRNGMPETAELYKQIPCYVGWTYCEFDIDGTMRPCEKSQIVLGKAGSSKIRKMWRSQPYRQFRREGRSLPTRREAVTGCVCGTCGMAKFNINIHNLLHLKSMRYYET